MSEQDPGIDQLADEYWSWYLDQQPTHAHLIGDYTAPR